MKLSKGLFSQNVLLSLVGLCTLIGVLFAFHSLGQRHKVSAKPDTEMVEQENDDDDIELDDSFSKLSSTSRPRVSTRTSAVHRQSAGTMTGFVEGKNADLLRYAGDSFVYGLVTDQSGKPVNGATVQALPYPLGPDPTVLKTTSTDQNGSYSLERLSDSDAHLTIIAIADSLAPSRRFIRLREEPQRVDFHMSPGVTVTGTVIDGSTSSPLEGATVYLPDYYPATQTMSGAGGKFSLANVPALQSLRISAKKDNYVEHSNMNPRQSRNNKSPDGIVIVLMPGGCSIRGTVVDHSEMPVSGARVKLTASRLNQLEYPALQNLSPVTKDDGAFELKNLPPNITIKLSAIKGMEGKSQSFTLKEMESLDNVKLSVPTSLYVSGRVIHANSSKPVPGIKIGYAGIGGKKAVLTDDEGGFFFHTMAVENKYSIHIDAKGLVPIRSENDSTTQVTQTIERDVPKGASTDEVTIKLISTPSITGKVKLSNGRAAKFLNVIAVHQTKDGSSYSEKTATNHKGNYYFNLVDSGVGIKSIIYASQNRRSAAISLVSRSKTKTKANLNLKQKQFSGQLYLSDRTALSGVTIKTDYIDSASGLVLNADTLFSSVTGRFSTAVATGAKLYLTFYLPNGVILSKNIDSSSLNGRQTTFVYDPTANTITMKNQSKRK